MRPLVVPSGVSCTRVLPMSQRAIVAVSRGRSFRRSGSGMGRNIALPVSRELNAGHTRPCNTIAGKARPGPCTALAPVRDLGLRGRHVLSGAPLPVRAPWLEQLDAKDA